MHFVVKTQLQACNALEQQQPTPLHHSMLVGVSSVADFECDVSQYGSNYAHLFPAFYRGGKCWLLSKVWYPATGYSCGYLREETIVKYKDGIKMLTDHLFFSDYHKEE